MRELHFVLKNSAWIILLNFTREGSVIATLLLFEQGSILCWAIFGENTFLNTVRCPWKEGIVTIKADLIV